MTKKDQFLKNQKVLHLSTINKRGIPHIVPVWYLYSTKKVYVGTNTKTNKAKNIKKNNRVAFCVDIGINSPDIYGVMGQGNAKLILEKARVIKITKKILLRYFESLESKSAQELLTDTDCIIEITPKEFAEWSY